MTSVPNFSAGALPASTPLKTVVLNGSLHKPSRTQTLLAAIHAELVHADTLELTTEFVEIADFAKELGSALSVSELPAQAKRALDAVEAADFVIVGSPVYRAAMPGLLKHFFDLIDLL